MMNDDDPIGFCAAGKHCCFLEHIKIYHPADALDDDKPWFAPTHRCVSYAHHGDTYFVQKHRPPISHSIAIIVIGTIATAPNDDNATTNNKKSLRHKRRRLIVPRISTNSREGRVQNSLPRVVFDGKRDTLRHGSRKTSRET